MSAREEIAEVVGKTLLWERERAELVNELLPLVDRLRAEAAAEALEDIADDIDASTTHRCDNAAIARERAAVLRTEAGA